jgi:hypothetical protein
MIGKVFKNMEAMCEVFCNVDCEDKEEGVEKDFT